MRAFTLVLAGGGARGFAHAGVLRALVDAGMVPGALVGVSMGAVVAATYASRLDWYDALMGVETATFPHPFHGDAVGGEQPVLRRAVGYVHTAWNMVTGWGAPTATVEAARQVLTELLGASHLEEGRAPVVVCATDLRSGRRVAFHSGNAAEAVYASSALAGVLPPLRKGDQLLADGAYSDIAPIDVAQELGNPVVMVVDPSQPTGDFRIENGLQSVMRAVEICHLRHAELRMHEADLVLRPDFDREINVLEFDARQECVAAGAHAVDRRLGEIRAILQAISP